MPHPGENPLLAHAGPILVTCAKGISAYLAQEIRRLGLPVLTEAAFGVETEGTLDDVRRMNLWLRTAQRVLWRLRDFTAHTADDLYRAVAAIAWEDLIEADGYVCVNCAVSTPAIRDTRFASLKCKDAIVDRIREKRGRRPDSGSEPTHTVVFLYWKDARASVYLDTSGEPLSRRGYRQAPLEAPMQEALAAAVVIATAWDGGGHFVNPMCGSGTLAIEAALIALDRAPGLLRDNFGFMHVKGFPRERWQRLRETARTAASRKLRGRVIATDIRAEAVAAARRNARTAGVEHLIEFGVCDFAATPIPAGGGVVVLNPEYGERMGDKAKLEGTYRAIGDFFKQQCQGATGYLFTGNLDLAKRVGLRSTRRILFFNGNIECRLLAFELYAGSRRPPVLHVS
jgi:23S rRNA G2445 N2-methylase RlmL